MSQNGLNSQTHHDFNHLVQTELNNLRAALHSGEPLISYTIYQPLSEQEHAKRVHMMKILLLISSLLLMAYAVYAIFFMFADDTLIQMIFAAVMVIFFIVNAFSSVRLLKRVRENRMAATQITLDFNKQTATIVASNQSKHSLKFHSQGHLPAFVLPSDAPPLKQLYDEVQHLLRQKTGLPLMVAA